MASRYYGTPELLDEREDRQVKQYIRKNLGKTIHAFEKFLVDEALMTPANLDCFHCHQVHGHNCCEGGQPYSMEGKNLENFNQHAFLILKEYNEDGRHLDALQKGIFEKTKKTNYYPSIRTYQGNCLFLVEKKGLHICAIHRYGLDHDINPYSIKPFSCSLFPLEMIEVDHQILITAITRQTESFSRWGSYYRKNYSCINREHLPAHSPKDYFSIQNTIPSWMWSKDLLCAYFGEETVSEIEKRLPL